MLAAPFFCLSKVTAVKRQMQPSQSPGVTLRRAGPVVSYTDPGGLEGLCWSTAHPMSGLQENPTLTATGDTALGQSHSTPVGDSHAWHGVLLAWISIGTYNSPGGGRRRPLTPVSWGRA